MKKKLAIAAAVIVVILIAIHFATRNLDAVGLLRQLHNT